MEHPAGKPRDRATLEQQIMDSCIAKSDAEWWAMGEIERLRADNERLKEWCRKLIESGEFPSSNEQLATGESND